jgi:hypothetical protein
MRNHQLCTSWTNHLWGSGFMRGDQCCGSGTFIPDPYYFHPGSASKIKKFCTQKIFSDIWYVLFIPDPDPEFLPIPNPWVKLAIPDPQHWWRLINFGISWAF